MCIRDRYPGVAPGSQLIALKVLDRKGNGQKRDVLRALEWIRQNRRRYRKMCIRDSVVGTPGSGFGPSGEGYFRLTAFGTYEKTVEAIERIKRM